MVERPRFPQGAGRGQHHVARAGYQAHPVVQGHGAVGALRGGPHPDDVAVGGDQIAIEGKRVRFGGFGENLDQPRHDVGVIAEVGGPGNDDLGRSPANVDVRMVAIGFLFFPAGGARVGGQRRGRDAPQGTCVLDADSHRMLPPLDCSIKRRSPVVRRLRRAGLRRRRAWGGGCRGAWRESELHGYWR